MKKKVFSLMMTLLLAFVGVAKADVVTIGDPTATTTSSYVPGYSLYDYAISQQIYTADEIGMAGTINTLTVWLKNSSSYARDLNVYMKEVSESTFASNSAWVSMTASDLVASFTMNNGVSNPVATAITLSTPFAYSGNGNLVICFQDVSGQWSSGLAGVVMNANGYQALYAYRDGTVYDPSAVGVSGTLLTTKNVVALDITTAGGGASSELVNEGFEGAAMPLGWTVEGDGEWTIGVGDNTTSTGTHSGDYNAKCIHSTIGNHTYLVSPALDLSEATDATLNCWFINRAYAGQFDEFGVYYRVDGGAWNELYYTDEAHEAWTEMGEIALQGFRSANYQLGFLMLDGYGNGVGLDDVVVNANVETPGPGGMTHDYLHVAYMDGEEVVIDELNLGVRPAGPYWMAPFPFKMYNSGNVALNIVNVDFTPSDGTFTVNEELPYALASNQTYETGYDLTITTHHSDAGIVEQQFVALTEGDRAAHIWNITAEFYTPECPDIWELAYEVPADQLTNFSDVPVNRLVSYQELHNDYTLPFPEIPEGEDAVYKLNIPGDMIINAWVEGEDGKVALYTQDGIDEVGGPAADNYYSEGMLGTYGAGGGAAGGGELTVHDATVTSSYIPVYGLWMDDYTRSEMVFPAAELTAMNGQYINSLTFYTSTPATATWDPAVLQVYMKEVASTTLSAYSGMEGATVVYTGGLDGTGAEMTVNFSTPYHYNGGNLLVGFYQTVEGTYKSCYFYGETVTGASASGYNSNSAASASFNQRNFLPKTTFAYGNRNRDQFAYDFEGGMQNWTSIDNDADGNGWFHSSLSETYSCYDYTGWGNNGTDGFAVSQSYTDCTYDAYDADNYLVSPQKYNIEAGSSVNFYFDYANDSYPDYFEVCVATVNNPTANDFTSVWNVNMRSNSDRAEVRHLNNRYNNWRNVNVDLSAYAGQEVWIAFHHEDLDNYELFIDDVTINAAGNSGSNPGEISGFGGSYEISEGPEIINLPVRAGVYYLAASSNQPDFEVFINAEPMPCPEIGSADLRLPADGEMDLDPAQVTLHWQFGQFTTEWRLVVGTTYFMDENHPQTVVYPANDPETGEPRWSTDLSMTSYTLHDLWHNTQYFWKIEQRNGSCTTGTDTDIWGFTTKFRVPTNLQASNERIFEDEPVTFTWNPIVDRTYRRYRLYQDGEIIYETPDTYVPTTYTSYTLAANSLTRNIEGYTFQVSAVYDEGESDLSQPVIVHVGGYATRIAGGVYQRYDNEAGQPVGINGATVTFEGTDEMGRPRTYTGTTNAQGAYQVTHVALSNEGYDATAMCAGFQTVYVPEQGEPVPVNYNQITEPIDFRMDENFTGVAHVWADYVEVNGEELVKVWWDWNFFETLTENFEDWANTPYAWVNNSAHPWALTTEAHEGTYAMRSGNAGIASSVSALEVTINIPQDGEFSFWYNPQGEGTGTIWDKCEFYLDGVRKFQYGANNPGWHQYSQAITGGPHTFRWVYDKDGSVNPTGDNFTIDDIIFVGNGERADMTMTRDLDHYRIYRTNCYNYGDFTEDNTILLATAWVPDTAYIDVSWPQTAPGVYKWGVGAVYSGNLTRGETESQIVWAENVNRSTTFTSASGNTGAMSQSTGMANRDGWYYYDNGVNEDAIGTGGGEFWWGIMIPAGSYTETSLTKVSAYDYMAMSGDVTIYNDGANAPAGAAVGTTSVNFTGSEQFVEFNLSNVTIDPTKNLWVILHNASSATYPAAVCNNTGDPNGRWVSLDGASWEDLAGYDLDYTFMIRAYLEDNGGSGQGGEGGGIIEGAINYLALERESPTVWSNCLDKDMYLLDGDVTVNVLLNSADSPEGVKVTFVNRIPEEQELYPMDPIVLDQTGFYAFDSFRKGDYDITIENTGYYTMTDTARHIWEPTDLRYVMEEILYPVRDLYVSNTGWAMWADESGWENGGGDGGNGGGSGVDMNIGFEEGAMPEGWTVEGNGTWTVGTGDYSSTTGAHTGNYNAKCVHASTGNQTYLVSPAMNLSGVTSGTVNCWFVNRSWVGDTDEFGVYYRVNGGAWNQLYSTTAAHETWTEMGAIALTGFADNYQIGFKMKDNYGYGVGLDDITIQAGSRNGGERHLEGYKVMCTSIDNEPIYNTNTPAEQKYCQLETSELVEGETYLCKVAAIYSTGMSAWRETEWVYRECDNWAQTGNEVTFENNTITWTYPGGGVTPTPPGQGDTFTESWDAGLNGWTNIDNDGDGHVWYHSSQAGNHSTQAVTSHSGAGHLMGESYCNGGGALHPDDYLVSPQQYAITNGSTLTFWGCAQDVDYAAEHFGVAISTTGNTSAADFTTIQEWTLTAKSAGNPNADAAPAKMVRGRANRQTREGAWHQYTCDLSAYAGQNVWIAIRHFNCTDEFIMLLDDAELAIAGAKSGRARWDLVHSFTGTSAGQQAVATDGTNIYTASWQSDPTGGYTFYQYDLTGNFIEGFNIAGATGIRDLTYDGQYFYASSGGANVYVLDLAARTLVSTINCTGATSRHISYDPARDGFWIGDWSSLALYSRTGAQVQSAPAPTSAYSSVYFAEDGVEHLYLFCQPDSDAKVYDYNITTNTMGTSPIFDFAVTPGFGGIAGGSFLGQYNGMTCWFGNCQQDPNLIGIYEFAAGTTPEPPVVPTEGILGVMVFVDGEWVAQVDYPANTYEYEGEGEEICIRLIYDGEMDGTYYSMSCPECAEIVSVVTCEPGDPIFAEAIENDQIRIYWGNEPAAPVEDWLYYFNENVTQISPIGTGQAYDVYWGIMIPADMLAPYVGTSLTKVALYEVSDYNTNPVTVNIYLGGANSPQTLVSTMTYTPSVSDDFEEVTLTTAVPVDGTQNLWITFKENGTYPCLGVDTNGDPNARWVSLDGTTWEDIAGYGLNSDWLIKGFVTNQAKGGEITPIEFTPGVAPANVTFRSAESIEVADLSAKTRAAELVGYNVYRSTDNETYEFMTFVEVNATNWYEVFDTPEANGTYYYQVRALYSNDCESEPAASGVNPDQNYVSINFVGMGENVSNVALFPNPTKGNVTIQANGMSRITVVSVLGQVVFDTELNADEYILNMAQFNAGMYLVRIYTENGVNVERVTVMQ